MKVSLVVAASDNHMIGKDNQLLWHLPKDMRFFKNTTWAMPILMGRKTFESFPKPLPNRTHIVITRQKEYHPEGCIIVESMEKAIDVCPENEVSYIIGGGEIYNLGLPFTDKIEITRVHGIFEADAFFPEINLEEWKITTSEFNAKDEKHLHDYTYETFIRK